MLGVSDALQKKAHDLFGRLRIKLVRVKGKKFQRGSRVF